MTALLNAIGGLLVGLVGFLTPVLAILALSVLVSAGSLLVFKWTSDQEKIRRAKGPVKAHLLGVLLFRNDLRLVFRSLFAALGHSLAALRFLLLPMAVMIVPLFLLFVQLDLRLGMTGLAPGKTTVLEVRMRPGANLDAVALTAPPGVVVDSPGVRVRDPGRRRHEVDWRLKGGKAGRYDLTIRTAAGVVTKTVTVANGPAFASPVRESSRLAALLLAPAEPAIPAGSDVESIELSYPAATYPFLGIDWAWWTLFLVFMVLALYALRGPLGVDF